MKKNRHRAGRRKREAIERTQAAELERAHRYAEEFLGRPIARVAPQPAPDPPVRPGHSIPTFDIQDEDTVPLDQYQNLITRAEAVLDHQNIVAFNLDESDPDEPSTSTRSRGTTTQFRPVPSELYEFVRDIVELNLDIAEDQIDTSIYADPDLEDIQIDPLETIESDNAQDIIDVSEFLEPFDHETSYENTRIQYVIVTCNNCTDPEHLP